MTSADIVPVDERDVVWFVRNRKKAHDRRSTVDRLVNAYMALFGLFYVGLVVAGFIDADVTPEPDVFLDAIVWLPLVLLGVMWAVLRFGTWQGPVLFTEPDLQWVLSAPLSRRTLVLMRLWRALVVAALAGIVGGAIVAIAVDVMLGESQVAIFAISAFGFGAVAVTATAVSWHVERSAQASRIVNRAAPLALLLAGGLTAAAATGRGNVLWWSGPWGWAVGPIADRAGWAVPGWPIQVGLLAVVAVGAVVSAVVRAGWFSEEELWRRAAARSVASAAVFFGDVRTLRTVARRDRTRGRVRGRRNRMWKARSEALVIASRDALVLRRNPRLGLTAAVFMAGATAAGVAAADHPFLAIAAFICLYISASRLLEPMRIEVDQPDAHHLLPWPWGIILALHCVAPTVALTALGWLGLVVAGAAGLAPWSALAPFALVAPFGAGAIVTAAAISSARERFPVGLVVGGQESGGMLLFLWLLTGPLLAAIVVNVAFGLMRPDLEDGLSGGTVIASAFLMAATLGFLTWLRTRKPPE